MGLKLIKLSNVLSELGTVVSISCAQDCPLSLGCPLPLLQPNALGCPIKMEMGFVLQALWTHQELIHASQAPSFLSQALTKYTCDTCYHQPESQSEEQPTAGRLHEDNSALSC